jgi:hypothetical protein
VDGGKKEVEIREIEKKTDICPIDRVVLGVGLQPHAY